MRERNRDGDLTAAALQTGLLDQHAVIRGPVRIFITISYDKADLVTPYVVTYRTTRGNNVTATTTTRFSKIDAARTKFREHKTATTNKRFTR